jgi:hypothetical protein
MNEDQMRSMADQAATTCKEVLDNIKTIKGENYAKLIHHSVGLNLIAAAVNDPGIVRMLEVATMAIMSDLAKAYGIDLHDKEVAKEVRRNFLAAMPKEPV